MKELGGGGGGGEVRLDLRYFSKHKTGIFSITKIKKEYFYSKKYLKSLSFFSKNRQDPLLKVSRNATLC